jgi:hypothetical protein
MNKYFIHFTVLLVLIFTVSFTTIDSSNSITNAQVDPSQEQIGPIPPSNNTNVNQTIVIMFFSN